MYLLQTTIYKVFFEADVEIPLYLYKDRKNK